MDPLSQLPYELLSLIIEYAADWITLESLIQISPPLRSLFTISSSPSTSPKTRSPSQKSAQAPETAHPEAIRLVDSIPKHNPMMSRQLKCHFHIITKLRQPSLLPDCSANCFADLLAAQDKYLISYAPPTRTTLLEMIALASNIQRLACACLTTLLSHIQSVHPRRWIKDIDPGTCVSKVTNTEPCATHDARPPSWNEENRVYHTLWYLQLRYELLYAGETLGFVDNADLKRLRNDCMGVDNKVLMLYWVVVEDYKLRTVVECLQELDLDLNESRSKSRARARADTGTETGTDRVLRPRARPRTRPSTKPTSKEDTSSLIRNILQKTTQRPLLHLNYKSWSPPQRPLHPPADTHPDNLARRSGWTKPGPHSMATLLSKSQELRDDNNKSKHRAHVSAQILLQSWRALGMAIWDRWRLYGLGLSIVEWPGLSTLSSDEVKELPRGPRPAFTREELENRLLGWVEGWMEICDDGGKRYD
ncbi:hypothetical protein ASPBRDRAFT_195570 [Aspergillus brasiliensis CBS 101740]|uniref:Uncharacterized protein n=1 Tax=Aspergillus brasiliensis (strain CBS 101740 / IMI 381727 / IBT 21946) TaxID=767769 RepID=A0A1L9UN44_ASPBC|nr:hypothetical protein ASPBRDRAFT_195570 [Aspergillus brasiliensis CBS 101740]